MKKSNQLVLQSAVVASLVIMVVLGGVLSTTVVRPSFVRIGDPANVQSQYDPDQPSVVPALAQYYNVTLSYIGAERFENASFLLNTFHLVNIPPAVNQTALLSNEDLAAMNASMPSAIMAFDKAEVLIASREFLNASLQVSSGCQLTRAANESFADFTGPRTMALRSQHVPVEEYNVGSSQARAEIQKLLVRCHLLSFKPDGDLAISSMQGAVRTGGKVALEGTLSLNSSALAGQRIHFYVNGSHFGTLLSGASGGFSGTMNIPFLYGSSVVIQALAAPNATVNLGGARSNLLGLSLVYNRTSISVDDPPTYLPGETFVVSGTLTTEGNALASAKVNVTSFGHWQQAITNTSGEFSAQLTVPKNATDGTYQISASFAPLGVLGPSRGFTSIIVAHLPVNLTLSAPLSLAGFPVELSGSALNGGKGVEGVEISIDTPWGPYYASSDSSGHFIVRVTSSPLDFALAETVSARVAPEQPFVSAHEAFASMSLFNMLLVPLLIVGGGVVSFQAYNAGAFEGLRRRKGQEQAPALERPATDIGSAAPSTEVPGLILLYLRAITLASAKFGLRFGQSQTIRESLNLTKAASVGPGFEEYERILLATEDFLYAPGFDVSRTEGLRTDLSRLEVNWK